MIISNELNWKNNKFSADQKYRKTLCILAHFLFHLFNRSWTLYVTAEEYLSYFGDNVNTLPHYLPFTPRFCQEVLYFIVERNLCKWKVTYQSYWFSNCLLVNFKYSLLVWFGLIWFYGISTILGYLMPNPLYKYISNIYDLVWFGFMAHQPL